MDLFTQPMHVLLPQVARSQGETGRVYAQGMLTDEISVLVSFRDLKHRPTVRLIPSNVVPIDWGIAFNVREAQIPTFSPQAVHNELTSLASALNSQIPAMKDRNLLTMRYPTLTIHETCRPEAMWCIVCVCHAQT